MEGNGMTTFKGFHQEDFDTFTIDGLEKKE